jgi:hypothetical protein
MSTFDDREHAFEAKYALDAEMQFKVAARRDKLVGLWAAGLMGKSEDDAKAYAADVVREDLKHAGDEDVYEKLAADLGSLADEATIRAKMKELLLVAKDQVMKEVV